MTDDDDWSQVPNVCEVRYEAADATYSGFAFEIGESPTSIDTRGYRVKATEEISDLDEDDPVAIQAKLDALAIQKLKSKQARVAANEFTGEYVPGLNISDTVGLRWLNAGIDNVRSIYSMETTLTGALQTNYRIREYIRGGVYTNVEPE